MSRLPWQKDYLVGVALSAAERDEIMSLFEQYPLFAPEIPALVDEEKKSEGRTRKKSRTYDLPVLRWVAYHRVVTVHQVVYRFFVYAGRGGGYGFRIVQGLVKRGLLDMEVLDAGKGAVSRHVLTVSDQGWEALGEARPKDQKRVGVEILRDYRIQFAEMMLVRELEGWSLLSEEVVWKRLREWALEEFRGKALSETERAIRGSLERTTDVSVGVNGLWHRKDKRVRLLIPVRRGLSFTRIIERLPKFLGTVPKIEFELVVSEPSQGALAREALLRWGERVKVPVEIFQVDHFRTRAHPNEAKEEVEDLYYRNNVPDPRVLLL